MRELAVSRLAAMNEDIENLSGEARATSSTSYSDEAYPSAPVTEIAEPEPVGMLARILALGDHDGEEDTPLAMPNSAEEAAAAANERRSHEGHSSVHSSVLGEMFDDRLSDRLDQLLPADVSRGSRRSSSRQMAAGMHAERSIGDDFVRRFLEEEAADKESEPGDQVAVGEKEPVGSSSRARARAKLDAKANKAAASGLSPEQVLAARVLEAKVTISGLMQALEQVLAAQAPPGAHYAMEQQQPPPLEPLPDADDGSEEEDAEEEEEESLLDSVVEEEEEEEEGDEGEEEDDDDDDEVPVVADLPVAALLSLASPPATEVTFAVASPPPASSSSAARGIRRKPAPRVSKLRRKDTAAGGALGAH